MTISKLDKKELKIIKKRKKERKKKNNRKKEVDPEIQLNAIIQSIKQNWIFYIVLLCCLFAFTKCQYNKSYFVITIFTFWFITLYGYVMHFMSHYMKTTMSDIYKTYDNLFTRNKYLDWIARKFIYFTEFHATTHHDTEINKQYKNIALEILNNLATQGVILICIKYLLNFLDNRVILLWAFFYATVHNFNYLAVKPQTHKEHHIDDNTNYGIDIWDIIIGSKYDWTNIETHNHAAINLIVITAVIIYLSNKFKW